MHMEMTVKAQYRANMLIGLIGLLVEPMVYLIVWLNVANAQGGEIGGYTVSDIAAYYMVLLLVRHASSAPGPHLMAWRIREGHMSFMLLRPVHPIWGDFAEATSYRLSTIIGIVPIMAFVGIVFGARFTMPEWYSLLAFIPAILMAGVLRFMLHFTIAMIGFWTDRIDSFWSTYWTLQTFLSGMLAPLPLLPEPMQVIATILPFRWVFSYPIDLILRPMSPTDVMIGLGMQIIWSAALIGIMQVMWRAGTKRYGAVGG